MKAFEYVIKDQIGIHARPAGMLVKTAQNFKDTDIKISKGEKSADAKKLFGVMGLGVKCGDKITISANGPQEEQAINQMEEFLSSNL